MEKRLREHPDLPLVEKGVKPFLFINLPRKSHRFVSFEKNNLSENIIYFKEPWFGSVNILVFNLEALKKIIPVLNNIQSTYRFNSVEDVINLICDRYKFREQSRKASLETKKSYILVEGVCFGYPLPCVKAFIREQLSKVIREDRIEFRISEQVVFIGYPEYIKESQEVISRWKKALK